MREITKFCSFKLGLFVIFDKGVHQRLNFAQTNQESYSKSLMFKPTLYMLFIIYKKNIDNFSLKWVPHKVFQNFPKTTPCCCKYF